MSQTELSEKSRLVAALLCFFFGCFGIHRFYVGKIGTGILQLLTFGGFTIWALIDFIIILVGSFRDADDKRLFHWTEPLPSGPAPTEPPRTP